MRVEDIEESQSFFTTTVALVTSVYGEQANVMSAEWSIRVSIDPFLMAVFVGYQRGTYDIIKNSGEYGLSYCSDQQGHLAHIAGNYSVRDHDKFGMAEFRTFGAKYIRAPLIEGSISNFECRVVDEFKVGDHAAFIGEVLTGYYDDEKKPLVFHGGHFSSIGNRLSRS